MATDWGFEENATDALTRLTNLIDESAESTADNESLRIVSVSGNGSVVNPDEAPNYPNSQTISHDLDPNAQGDLSVEVAVARSQAILIAANSIDGNNWSASVDWLDSSGNVFQAQTATDVGLSSVSDENARLYRKGPRVKVTFTSEAAGGTQNRINAFLDTHR